MPVHLKISGEDGEPLGEWITEDDGTHRSVRTPDTLTFGEVAEVNADRAREWHGSFPETGEDGWTGADWSNALAGEVGEACNIVKKLRRQDIGVRGSVDGTSAELREQLAMELADVFIYLDLLATKYGIDLPAAIIQKFNAISEREGLPQRLEIL